MKKLVLFAAVILSMSAISCGNGEKGAAKDSVDSVKDSTKVEAEAPVAPVADSVVVDSVK
ncbi:MAG: hypothetical protein ACI30P_01175 [Muribaculaceae bacterium]